jgi:predicted nucleic acid-binding protein
MILVDSCVIFAHTRGKDPRLGGLFRTLTAVCGVVRAGVLHGARDPADRATLIALLDRFAQILTTESIWDATGANLAMLRRAGITVPFADVVQATITIEGAHEIWTRDAHFGMMQSVLLKLRLFKEPP